MNDIKTIEELRAHHERLKGVVTALKRLEKRLDAQGRKDTQSGTDDTPLHRTPPRPAGVAR
jgi:hypothetical protein